MQDLIPRNIKIYPSLTSGTVTMPPSKSLSHRAIIMASLASGRTVISNYKPSLDINATISIMVNLGANIVVKKDKLVIDGITDYHNINGNILDAKESASTLRFIIPLLELFDTKFVIKGSKALFNRPLECYSDLFKKNNSLFELNTNTNELLVKPVITSKTITLDGSISSQFITGLLIYLPLRNVDTKLIVHNLVSYDYFLLTIETLKHFGIEVNVTFNGADTICNITGNQKYLSADYEIEGDYSQMANFLVLGTINNDLKINGLNLNTLQGDKRILSIFPNAKGIKNGYEVTKFDQEGLYFDIKNNPDLGPILMAYFAFTGGRIDNVNRLVYKESNRITSMMEELNKLNINVKWVDNSIHIEKKDLKNLDILDLTFDSHNDHRIFMALAILSSVLKNPVTITNSDAVSKSYPEFINDIKKLGIKIDEEF